MRPEMRADWVSLAEARERVLGGVHPLEAERRPLLRALGAVLAEDVAAPMDLPLWDNSAMDGFAVRAEEVRGASAEAPVELPVTDDVPAGRFPREPLRPGTAVRVMTGAPIPAGADSVIRQEHTSGGRGTGEVVRILSDADAGRNVRSRGEDMRQGEVVLRAGAVLRAAEVGVASAVGRRELAVVRRPVVAVLTSGDELVDVDHFDEVLAGRRIVSSNGYALAAQIAEAGMEARLLGIAADDPGSLRAHLERARGCDALVTSAGISVGEHDYLRDVLLDMGLEVEFWRVRMRPGSAFGFGRVGALRGIPWFGLPGNPASTMVTFELFVRPALLRMAGHTAVFLPTVPARVAQDVATGRLASFPRVRLQPGQDGVPTAVLTGTQSSGVLTSMTRADALLAVPDEPDVVRTGTILPALVLGGAPLREEPGY